MYGWGVMVRGNGLDLSPRLAMPEQMVPNEDELGLCDVHRRTSGFAAEFPLPKLAQYDCARVRRLLEVDQELRERLGPRIAEEVADTAGTLMVREHQGVLKHGA